MSYFCHNALPNGGVQVAAFLLRSAKKVRLVRSPFEQLVMHTYFPIKQKFDHTILGQLLLI